MRFEVKAGSDPLKQRFEYWKSYFQRFRFSDRELRAAEMACLNREERRRFLGERGPKRDLPRLMTPPKGRQR